MASSLDKLQSSVTEVPIVIGDEEIWTSDVKHQKMPFDHAKSAAKFCWADKATISRAIESCLAAREAWDRRPLLERAEIMFNAAELLQDKYRYDINAATMLGQGKTIIQAEIDAACELIDFLKFNAANAVTLQNYNPISPPGIKNSMIYRGLEGFVASITPFNFTAIAANLASCPALMGNVVMFKPSDTAILSNYISYKVLREAGVPAGVINFVPSDGPVFGDAITTHPQLACVNFTGSVPTFETLWKMVANNISKYTSFPRMIGECGGKNFHFVHPSADVETVANGSIRSAFEYSGQKCSACERLYVPESLWPGVKAKISEASGNLKLGSPLEVGTFASAVIDERSFARLAGILDRVQKSPAQFDVLAGGKADDSKGYYVEPTVVHVKNKDDSILKEEYFGPILPIVVYPDSEVDSMLDTANKSTPYGLTGAVFAQDKGFLNEARQRLRDSVGNLYLNDKSTGSVVGQQPFGGARKSGTNDKAGGPHYVLKFASPQTIKENFEQLTEVDYPYMRS